MRSILNARISVWTCFGRLPGTNRTTISAGTRVPRTRRWWSHGRPGFAKLPKLPSARRRVLTKAGKAGVGTGSKSCVSLDDSSKAGKNGPLRTIFLRGV
jgi:hypothetical protein